MASSKNIVVEIRNLTANIDDKPILKGINLKIYEWVDKKAIIYENVTIK